VPDSQLTLHEVEMQAVDSGQRFKPVAYEFFLCRAVHLLDQENGVLSPSRPHALPSGCQRRAAFAFAITTFHIDPFVSANSVGDIL
jgi:hypothetical protein